MKRGGQCNYVMPRYGKTEFHCPLCDVFAQQKWHGCFFDNDGSGYADLDKLQVSFCVHCNRFSYWIDKKLVYPTQITAPLPHIDMPKSVSKYYNEARKVSTASPRSAAALLRIAAKKLCEYLGEENPSLNLAIKNLSKKGLSQDVIKSLHSVRIVGNEGGAHEGQIDLTDKDNSKIVNKLFWLVNFITRQTITDQKEVDSIFNSLPEKKKQDTKERDKK